MTSAEAWRTARSRAHACGAALPKVAEPLGLADAVGRVLAEPLRARTPLPGFDTAAMDGYAVAGDGPWRVVGRALAGGPVARLGPGEALEIATGAPVPRGVHAVVPYELAGLHDGAVQLLIIGARHIRMAGEEAAVGAQLLPAGAVLRPDGIALAAAAGHDTLLVRARPRIEVIITGDEVVTSGVPADGEVRDALGPALPAMITWSGGSTTAVHHVGDAAAQLLGALEATTAEVVIVSGSSSAGPADHLEKCLLDLGAAPVIASVDCSPGRTQSLWQLADDRVLVSVPGNPLAAVVAYLTLVDPICAGLLGRPLAALATVASCAVEPHATRTRLVPVTVDGDVARPCEHIGSAMLRGLAVADALAIIDPRAVHESQQSGRVDLLPLPGGR